MIGMMGGGPPLQPFLAAPMGVPRVGGPPGMMMGGRSPLVDKRGMVEVEYADAIPGEAPATGG